MNQKVGLTITWIFFLILVLNNFSLVMNQQTSSPFVFLATSCYSVFNNGSQYEANLKTLFQYLSSNTSSPNGYHQAISGNGDDTVYGHFLCRGDLNASACGDCVTYAITTKLPEKCPNQKFAIIWFDECMLKYSYNQFFGSFDRQWIINYNSSTPISGDKNQFLETRKKMMIDRITDRASKGVLKKFATDYENVTDNDLGRNTTIYGLGQCTPDLSEDDCRTCLLDVIKNFQDFDGGKVFHDSCIARYKLTPFFDLSSVLPWPAEKGSVKSNIKMILKIVLPVGATLLVLVGLGLGIWFKKKRAKKYDPFIQSDEDLMTLVSLKYSYATLQSATNNFSYENKLGKGGFGVVYKGTLEDGRQVAVKKLSTDSRQGLEEFQNEVLLLAKLQHRNLVRLVGYCTEREEKLLVYEYVPNKSLDCFLFDQVKRGQLDWGNRYKIIEGIARGMLYLHEDSQPQIIHRDLKPSNVLLDGNMNPKVADFGLAKIFNNVDQTHATTSNNGGTLGYMSPEYVYYHRYSTKSDVYSFGVIILEIIRGRKHNNFHIQGEAEDDFQKIAWKQWRDKKVIDFVDPSIKDNCSLDEVLRCMQIGLLCIHQEATKRLTMGTIVRELVDLRSASLPEPEEPGLFTNGVIPDQTNWMSVNDLTVTQLDARS